LRVRVPFFAVLSPPCLWHRWGAGLVFSRIVFQEYDIKKIIKIMMSSWFFIYLFIKTTTVVGTWGGVAGSTLTVVYVINKRMDLGIDVEKSIAHFISFYFL
jgi:hypothetical protein